MSTTRSRGFTLIELLVVIAIIGILSAVVLASLSTARQKGQDAAVQANLKTIQTQAEMYYGGAGANSYGATLAAATCPTSGTTMFNADTTIKSAIASAESANGSANVQCVATATSGNAVNYAVLSQLPSSLSGTASYYCVDSTGFAGTRTGATFNGGACPTS